MNIKKGNSVFVAPTATLVGNINIGDESSIWFGAVLRADRDKIVIGRRSNIQDLSVIHVDPGFAVTIGDEVIVGHRCIIHGASIGNNTLIGMGTTVLNGATIGNYCLIGANSLITEAMQIPDNSLVFGSPAKVIKPISDEQRKKLVANAQSYVELAAEYIQKNNK